MYDFALVTKQQLEDVGFVDRPPGGGLGDPRPAAEQPARSTTSSPPAWRFVPDPTQHPYLRVRLAGLDVRRGDPEAHGR